MQYDYDFIVIGSGFGGSVSALRLAEKGYRVAVLEQGRRWTSGNLPRSNWNLARWIWQPALGLRGFFAMRFFKHLVVLHGNAVGGGSITYGNVLLVPPESVWSQGSWAGLNDWPRVMPGHFETARRMLGVATNRLLAPADLRLREMARTIGAENSFYPTEVGVFFGKEGDEPGATYADPYFGGEGPPRKSCISCGGCMVGCRHDAKNTLDRNYLYLAERKGAEVIAESKVVDVRPLSDRADGSAGYSIRVISAAKGSRGRHRTIACRGVVFAASSLGTQDLLFRLREKKSLPRISEALGTRVRTNAESLIGVRFPGSKVDLSKGIAIGSGIYVDDHTHIEAVPLSRRLGRHGPDSDRDGPQAPGSVAAPELAGHRVRPFLQEADRRTARLFAVRLGAGNHDLPLHANGGRPSDDAHEATLVLAVLQAADDSRRQDPRLYPEGA